MRGGDFAPHRPRSRRSGIGRGADRAYDLDWQGELIEDGVTGALVPHRNWEAMSDAVERFLLDGTHATAMSGAVRNRAVNMLDPAVLDQHERAQYARLLGENTIVLA
jgi:glycosyltransferase involved in cell wall biosynthesis